MTIKAHISVSIPNSKVHPAPGISIRFISSLKPIMFMALNNIQKPRRMGKMISAIDMLNISIKPKRISIIPLAKIHTLPVKILCEFDAKAKLFIPDTNITTPTMPDKTRQLILGTSIMTMPTIIIKIPNREDVHQNRTIFFELSKRCSNLFFIVLQCWVLYANTTKVGAKGFWKSYNIVGRQERAADVRKVYVGDVATIIFLGFCISVIQLIKCVLINRGSKL